MAMRMDREKVKEELSKDLAKLPMGSVPENMLSVLAAEGYYLNGNPMVADQMLETVYRRSAEIIQYYATLPMKEKTRFEYQYSQSMMMTHEIEKLLAKYKRNDLMKKLLGRELEAEKELMKALSAE